MHTGIFGTTQDKSYYMVDNCSQGEVGPDYVADVNSEAQMTYFPENSVDVVVADDGRFLRDDSFGLYQRMLKPGGILVFAPGGGLGWPEVDFAARDSYINLGEGSGRNAHMSRDQAEKLKDPKERKMFLEKVRVAASRHYQQYSFRRVNLVSVQEKVLFELTK
jgi:hypothetical protein